MPSDASHPGAAVDSNTHGKGMASPRIEAVDRLQHVQRHVRRAHGVIGRGDWKPGDRAVTTRHEHPGGLGPLVAARERFGIELAFVDVGDGTDDDATLAEPALLEQPPDDDSWLDDLDDLRDAYLSDRVTSATMALAGLIIQELRVRPEVRALDPRHPLHTALRAVPRLRADIARPRRTASQFVVIRLAAARRAALPPAGRERMTT